MKDFLLCSALGNEGNGISKPGPASLPWDINTTCCTESGMSPARCGHGRAQQCRLCVYIPGSGNPALFAETLGLRGESSPLEEG